MTEIMLGLAFLQQSAEHFQAAKGELILLLPRAALSLLLIFGLFTPWVLLALVILSLFILIRFDGPYNGGSDRMGLLILCCLCAAHFMPGVRFQEYAMGYLAVQLVLSYCMSGWVKIVNPEWRSGRALQDVFLFSAYPVSEGIRGWAHHARLLLVMSWAVMLFEIAFPFALLSHMTLMIGLLVAATFHLANACLFGLNRFFWIWLAAYPSILWLQQRLVEL